VQVNRANLVEDSAHNRAPLSYLVRDVYQMLPGYGLKNKRRRGWESPSFASFRTARKPLGVQTVELGRVAAS